MREVVNTGIVVSSEGDLVIIKTGGEEVDVEIELTPEQARVLAKLLVVEAAAHG